MLEVIGSVTIEFESDGEKTEQTTDGSEFSLQEGGWRNLGDGDRQYEALFIYFGDDFKILFQATYFDGKTTCYDATTEGDVRIIDDNLNVQYVGSGNEEDDFEEYQ
jgi:hypothetical protein